MTSLLRGYPPLTLSPEEFEKYVKAILDSLGARLDGYESSHRERVGGLEGDYEIDVTVRFSALGVTFLTLIECKHHKASIKREDTQLLWAKMQSIGAQKGIVFATSEFQSGAIEFAKAHGIALITVADGRTCYFTRSAFSEANLRSWEDTPASIPRVVGWLRQGNKVSLISEEDVKALAQTIGFSPSDAAM